MPSMSAGLSPASAIALSAASACNWICEVAGMTPGRAEEGEGDLIVELLEGDFDRHVELQCLGGLRAIDDVGHHPWTLLELDDGDRIGRREAWHRPVVYHIRVEPALAARREHADVARRASRAERPRREIHLAARVAALEAQLARPRAVPEMLRLGCRLRPRASSFGHFSHLRSGSPRSDFDVCREFGQTECSICKKPPPFSPRRGRGSIPAMGTGLRR